MSEVTDKRRASNISAVSLLSKAEDESSTKIGDIYFKTQEIKNQLKKELSENIDISFPVAVVGGVGAGKNSIFQTECGEIDFENITEGTKARIKIKTKVYRIGDKKVRVQYYIAPGNELLMKQSARFMAGFPAAIFIFDVNQENSLENITLWKTLMCPKSLASADLRYFLIGNKTDTPGKRVILNGDAHNYAQMNEMRYFESCSSDKKKVAEIFSTILHYIMDSMAPIKPLKGNLTTKKGSFLEFGKTDLDSSENRGVKQQKNNFLLMRETLDPSKSSWTPRRPSAAVSFKEKPDLYPPSFQFGLSITISQRYIAKKNLKPETEGTVVLDWL